MSPYDVPLRTLAGDETRLPQGQALLVVNVASRFFVPVGNGLNLIVFVAVFALAGFAMWRVWRDEHSYGY